ncbi:hypothetical protein Mapa_011777 [Marchantia paleacea]|nr:hypothetical protein Mapa_011777 [Marchantia paleacea]
MDNPTPLRLKGSEVQADLIITYVNPRLCLTPYTQNSPKHERPLIWDLYQADIETELSRPPSPSQGQKTEEIISHAE